MTTMQVINMLAELDDLFQQYLKAEEAAVKMTADYLLAKQHQEEEEAHYLLKDNPGKNDDQRKAWATEVFAIERTELLERELNMKDAISKRDRAWRSYSKQRFAVQVLYSIRDTGEQPAV